MSKTKKKALGLAGKSIFTNTSKLLSETENEPKIVDKEIKKSIVKSFRLKWSDVDFIDYLSYKNKKKKQEVLADIINYYRKNNKTSLEKK